jgi:hypothetical protein
MVSDPSGARPIIAISGHAKLNSAAKRSFNPDPEFVQMPDTRPLAAAWRSYAEKVIPPDATDEERQLTRMAYYAGARVMLSTIVKVLGHVQGNPTEEEMAALAQIVGEVEDFSPDVSTGRPV